SADPDMGISTLYYGDGWAMTFFGNFYVIRPMAENTYGMRGSRAFYIDQKLDDGIPDAGNVLAAGGSTTNLQSTCVTGSTYNVGTKTPGCNMIARIEYKD